VQERGRQQALLWCASSWRFCVVLPWGTLLCKGVGCRKMLCKSVGKSRQVLCKRRRKVVARGYTQLSVAGVCVQPRHVD
jgi:hypothetical protein